MRLLTQTAESIRATSKKTEKIALLADYFRAVPLKDAAASAILFSGRPFAPSDAASLQVGGSLLWRLAAQRAKINEEELAKIYRKFGDLGDALEAALQKNSDESEETKDGVSVLELVAKLREIAVARSVAAKSSIVSALLAHANPLEAKYIIKIMLGDLRIGLRESFVEEAIARAFAQSAKDVQRANMMVGDLAATLRLAAEGKLAEARMKLFHPIGFMLAAAVQTPEEAFACFESAAQIEDKYDGIRAQAHIGMLDGRKVVRIFSRTRDDVSAAFPELTATLACIPGELILDGEIVAWQPSKQTDADGRALPFSVLQQRLGRKQVHSSLQERVPVAYIAFDLLYADGELMIDRPLRERGERLNAVLESPREAMAATIEAPQGQLAFENAIANPGRASAEIIRAPIAIANSAEELAKLFDIARARGNEGLMIKNVDSLYTPERRGGAWFKLKRQLATLDVVVTVAEYGHGKRAGVLSDYTFAVRASEDDAKLLNVGKAYTGLTDAEIKKLTGFFLEHTLADEGSRRQVEPLVVLEVAFNNVMISDRHNSGFALRFPRIVRIRDDKSPQEIDTLAIVQKIYEMQHKQ